MGRPCGYAFSGTDEPDWKNVRGRAPCSARAIDQPDKTYRLRNLMMPEVNVNGDFFHPTATGGA
jgi:hypothetical protein